VAGRRRQGRQRPGIGAIFSGEAVPLYTGHLDDATVRALLNELATEMAEALGQEDVHLSFRDQAWALRRQKSEV
jgi:hypothetical protein